MQASRPRTTLLVSYTWAPHATDSQVYEATSAVREAWGQRRLPGTLALDVAACAVMPIDISSAAGGLDVAPRLRDDCCPPGRERATLCDVLSRVGCEVSAVFAPAVSRLAEHADLLAKRGVWAICPVRTAAQAMSPPWWQRLLRPRRRSADTAGAVPLRYGVWEFAALPVALSDATRLVGAMAHRRAAGLRTVHLLIDLSAQLRQPERLSAAAARLAAQVEGLCGSGAVELSTPAQLVAAWRAARTTRPAQSILRARAA